MLRNILQSSRYIVIIAVIGTFLGALTVFIYDGVTTVRLMLEVFAQGGYTLDGAKHLSLNFIEMIDTFLLGTVLYIISLGLYELFIDDKLKTPRWLIITSLDDLKERLLGVVVVLLAVSFLGYVVDWDGSWTIISLGGAVGLVLFALGFLLRFGFSREHNGGSEREHERVKDEE